jgi:hypothetical protein
MQGLYERGTESGTMVHCSRFTSSIGRFQWFKICVSAYLDIVSFSGFVHYSLLVRGILHSSIFFKKMAESKIPQLFDSLISDSPVPAWI